MNEQNGMTPQADFPEQIALAMAYVPMQRFEKIYDDDRALERGTIFEALDLPFKGGRQ